MAAGKRQKMIKPQHRREFPGKNAWKRPPMLGF
jgi:hypothetical protein